MKDKPLVNRVAQSKLKTINLEEYYPSLPMVEFDIANYLFKGLILKEKDFRDSLKSFEWAGLDNKILLVFCSTDAVIPVWAYMLVSGLASVHASEVFMGDKLSFLQHHYMRVLDDMDFSSYEEERVVVKGCSQKPVPAAAYAYLTQKLRPYAQSIMYGEPCSTVPIFKRPRKLHINS